MNQRQLVSELSWILNDTHNAVLATKGLDGATRMRWLSPALLSSRPSSILFLTWPTATKLDEIRICPDVQWLLQTHSLDRIARVDCTAQLLTDGALAQEVMDAIGPHIKTFWDFSPVRDLPVVVETHIVKAELLYPLKASRIVYDAADEVRLAASGV